MKIKQWIGQRAAVLGMLVFKGSLESCSENHTERSEMVLYKTQGSFLFSWQTLGKQNANNLSQICLFVVCYLLFFSFIVSLIFVFTYTFLFICDPISLYFHLWCVLSNCFTIYISYLYFYCVISYLWSLYEKCSMQIKIDLIDENDKWRHFRRRCDT